MNPLCGEIVTLLKAHNFGYDVQIVRSFDSKDKTFPRVVVRQIQDATLIRTIDDDLNDEALSLLAFQFEVYTKDAVINGVVKSRDEINDDLASQIDTVIAKQYRFNHDDTTEIKRYSTDVAMRLMRYSGVIDKFGYTYRSSRTRYGGYTYENFY